MNQQIPNRHYEELAQKWLEGTITPVEAAEYTRWFNEEDGGEVVVPAAFAATEQELKQRMQAGINRRIDQRDILRKRMIRIAAAAAVLVLTAGIAWLALQPADHRRQMVKTPATKQNDIAPGMQRATLTLDDGHTVTLDQSANGLLARQGAVSVNNINGSLVYTTKEEEKLMRYNTLTTHRGEQYPLVLSDGSKIFADAATTVRFPVAFTGTERRIEINGHAWVQVAQDARRPFFIGKGDKTVQVLGTEFDFNGYEEEHTVNVTLVQGSILVRNGSRSQILVPGQQALLENKTDRIALVAHADIELVSAWRRGVFRYKHATLEQVMKDMQRWYDIEVVYDNGKPADTFTGEISKTATLQEVIKIIETSRIHFTIQGKTVTVTFGGR